MKRLFRLFLLLITFHLQASHIVGGEIIYDFLGRNATGADIYRITLKIYRDCRIGNIDFDGMPNLNTPALITIREAANDALVGTIDMGKPVISRVPPSINNPCVETPQDICVEQGVYVSTLTLTPRPGGYYLIYRRCCRNNTINNLFAPSETGSTYYTRIPGPEEAEGNSSPRFDLFPPLFLCVNTDFKFNHAAHDPDGDRLEYSFYTPYTGGDLCCPAIGTFTPAQSDCPNACPLYAAPPPYDNVIYVSPYNYNYPVASSPSLSIDQNGLLTGRPTLIGQFVVGICVKEYRGDRLLNTHIRDFQFNIRACAAQVTGGMLEQNRLCNGLNLTFTNTSVSTQGLPEARWDFGVATLNSDTSRVFSPSYTYPDTGMYVVTLVSNPGKACSDTINRRVYVYPALKVNFPEQFPQCMSTNSFTFNAAGSYSTGTTFHWEFGSSGSPSVATGEHPPAVVYQNGGWYIVRLNASFGPCHDSYLDSVAVIAMPPMVEFGLDTTIVIGESVQLTVGVDPSYSYSWTPFTDYLNCSPCVSEVVQSKPPVSVVYTVLTADPYGCFVASRNYSVFVEFKASLDVPSAFTPNGDGLNDVIYAAGWGLKKLIYFRIYNRWGQLLFESNDLSEGWDGKFNGVPQNMDTYVYQVAAETWIREPHEIYKTGSFRLIR